MKPHLYKQRYSRSCGTACLCMALAYFGIEVEEIELIKRLGGLKSYGVCTRKLAKLAPSFGVKISSYTLKSHRLYPKIKVRMADKRHFDRLTAHKLPVFFVVDSGLIKRKPASRKPHNVLLLKRSRSKVTIADPSDGRLKRISEKTLFKAWVEISGKVVLHSMIIGPKN